MSHLSRRLVWVLVLALAAVACGGDDDTTNGGPAIGFIFVGERDDLGYNEAAWLGSEALARAFPEATILRRENVPETAEAKRAMEQMIDDGAGLIFATSFGHNHFARQIAEEHPDVVVVHQGGLEGEPDLPNFGTYFGSHHEFMYAAGIAAANDAHDRAPEAEGGATTHLGFIVAFPIPATYANVNAFTLGAQTVDPDVIVDVRFTDDWCDPAAQAEAFETLDGRGVRAIALHQDCTRTILQLAEDRGVGIVGYHADGSEVAPNSWILGPVWHWEDVMIDITHYWLQGRFAGSSYDRDFRGSLRGGDNPASLTEPGPRVSDETVATIDAVLTDFSRGVATPFDGPIVDTEGTVRIPAGSSASVQDTESMDYFVAGVVIV